MPHTLCVTGNSLWILSRFGSARPSMGPLNPTLFIFPTLPGAACHLSPAFWSFCDFPSYQGQSLPVVGSLGSSQGADDTQSLSLSPLRTAITQWRSTIKENHFASSHILPVGFNLPHFTFILPSRLMAGKRFIEA